MAQAYHRPKKDLRTHGDPYLGSQDFNQGLTQMPIVSLQQVSDKSFDYIVVGKHRVHIPLDSNSFPSVWQAVE